MPRPEAGLPPAPYDILFEPVATGPLVAKNRFFQVPHCNVMGYRDPSAQAAMRKVKAEGGWAVVCTEQVEIHPTSDITPFIELRIWDEISQCSSPNTAFNRFFPLISREG